MTYWIIGGLVALAVLWLLCAVCEAGKRYDESLERYFSEKEKDGEK